MLYSIVIPTLQVFLFINHQAQQGVFVSICRVSYFSMVVYFLLLPVAHASVLQDKLWLPISYQEHFVRLFEAAEKVSDLDDCNRFLSGTLDEKRSSNNDIVFSFRCRDHEREVFSVIVNAKDLKVTKMSDIWLEKHEKEQAAEKQRKLRRRLAERDRYWAVCEETFKDKTKTFNQVEIKTPFPIKPDITDTGNLLYLIEFQTLSLNKNVLAYLATAEIEHLHECKIAIRPI